MYLFYKVYSVSLDYPQRKMFNVLYRTAEYRQDAFSADMLGPDPIQFSLLRNYSRNLDSVFVDPFYSWMEL